MSGSSRVPLLPKGKSRKPSRLTIAPRAKPSTVDRSKRVATPPTASAAPVIEQVTAPTRSAPVDSSARTEKQATATPSARGDAHESADSAAEPSTIPIARARGSSAVTPAASVGLAAPAPAKRAGGIAIGGSLSTSPSIRKSSVAPVTRSPVIMPVQRHSDKSSGGQRVERLAKMSGATPVFRTHVSPVLGPRATLSAPQTAAKNGSNPIAKRLMHKLDIKPHQSPRRAAVQLQARHPRTESISSVTNSPLLLAGRAPPIVNKADRDADVLGEGVVGKHTNKRDDETPSSKRRQAKRHKTVDAPVKLPKDSPVDSARPRRQSLQRKAKTSPRYRNDPDSDEEPDDDQDEDVDPDELELPEDSAAIYVPARERATMWAKSLLVDDEQSSENANLNAAADDSGAVITAEKTSASPRGRRKRSNSTASSITSLISLPRGPSRKKTELMKKEPSQMTMGELALTIPKGRRMKRHEREEAADSAVAPEGGNSSNLLNVNALKRVRSLSVSSESTALGGSLVTPQVQIIDGKMVILESTIKLDEQLHQQLRDGEEDDGTESGIPPRHFGPRLNSSHPNGPGRRWGKEETKQFYYCLSQVGPNFSMMATLFPKRKRKELKSKFKFEEKNHPGLIEIALRASSAPLDSEMVDAIAKMVDKEAQRKLEQKKKRRRRSSVMDDDHEVESAKDDAERRAEPGSLLSPSSNTGRAHESEDDEEEVEEIVEDDEEYSRERHDSFDFAG